jgi:IS5 family transposase
MTNACPKSGTGLTSGMRRIRSGVISYRVTRWRTFSISRSLSGTSKYMKSKGEHVFAVVKGKFGYRKAAYRGLKKNPALLYMLFCGANLLRLSRSLA